MEKVVDIECGYIHSLILTLSGLIYMCRGVGIDKANNRDKDYGCLMLLQKMYGLGDKPKDVVK